MPYKSKKQEKYHQRQWYLKNRKRLLEKRKKYHFENKIREIKYCRIYYKKNKEKINAKNRKYRAKNKEKINKHNREWWHENKILLLQKSKQYRLTHLKNFKEYGKKYYQENKKRLKKKATQYYIKNKIRISKWSDNYYELNKEYIKKRAKKWYTKNKDKIKFYHRKQTALRKKRCGILTVKTIQQVYTDNIKKYGVLTCYLCFKPIAEKKDNLEHKTPLSRGGTNEYKNLAVAHQRCNSRKRTLTEMEYRKKWGLPKWKKGGRKNERQINYNINASYCDDAHSFN